MEEVGVTLHFSPDYMMALGMLRSNMWQHYRWGLERGSKGTNYDSLPPHPLHNAASLRTQKRENRLPLLSDKQCVVILEEEPFWRSEGRAALKGASVTILRPGSEAWILTLCFNRVTPEKVPKRCGDGNYTLLSGQESWRTVYVPQNIKGNSDCRHFSSATGCAQSARKEC